MKIEDGTGSGKQVKVSSQNRLSVNSVGVEEITHISSVHGNAYNMHFERTLVAGNTFEDVGHFTYNGEHKLQIDTITISREDVALNTASQAVVELLTGVIYTSGGDTISAANLNLGSSNILDSVIHSGTTTIISDKTDQVEVLDLAFRDIYDIAFDGSLILNKGDDITLVGKSKNIGDTIHIVMSVYEVTEVI